jgi:hypothetical protein
VDSYFNQVRTRLSPRQRTTHSSSSAGRIWYGMQSYDPRLVQKLLDLLRLFHNFCLKTVKTRRPQPRARAPNNLDDVIYLPY